MINDEWNFKEYLNISLEPDIHLSTIEQIHLDKCLLHLFSICHFPLVLNCTLLSLSNFDRESIRINHYLRVRQPRKYYWMRNIKQMYLNIHLPTNKNEELRANLMEFHSCKRLPYSARTIIEQLKPILLIYYIEERCLRLNIRGENCLLQLLFSSERNSKQGIYYKWSDEGHIRSTTIQFDINYN